MFAIPLSNEMIIREVAHSINRDEDRLIVQYAVALQFGGIASAENRAMAMPLVLQIAKERHPLLWDACKDTSNQNLIRALADMLNEVVPIKLAVIERNANPIFRRAAQVTSKGQTVFYYEDEDEEAFKSALQKTAQAPVDIRQPNEFAPKLEELSSIWPVEEFGESLQKLISIGVVGNLTIKEI